MAKQKAKRGTQKSISEEITAKAKQDQWTVHYGRLKGEGRGDVPHNNLFKVVAEKIPRAFLMPIKKHMNEHGFGAEGIYVCHDSMGTARYIGRGDIISRINKRFKAHPDELLYFSFYVVELKNHEREIETLLIRAAGSSLEFNERKKRIGISPGRLKDYEAGTEFYERQRKKGKKVKKAKKVKKKGGR